MVLKDDYDFDLLVNEIENLVIDELGRQLSLDSNRDVCRCQDCVLDMAALALNHLKPAYRSSLSYKGVLYKQNLHSAKKDMSYEKVVKVAIEKIAANPAH